LAPGLIKSGLGHLTDDQSVRKSIGLNLTGGVNICKGLKNGFYNIHHCSSIAAIKPFSCEFVSQKKYCKNDLKINKGWTGSTNLQGKSLASNQPAVSITWKLSALVRKPVPW
jgi:hypothetical protein